MMTNSTTKVYDEALQERVRKSCCVTCAGALPPPDRYRPAMNTSFCWQKALPERTM